MWDVEDEGGGQSDSGHGGESVAQVDGSQRIEALVLKGPVQVDGGGGGVPEHCRHFGADQVENELVLLGPGQPGQPVGQRPGRTA